MRPGGGKQKGSSFEREVCEKLSAWVSNGTRRDLYWRSAMSGGRATVALRGGDALGTQAGDVSAIDPLGELFLRHFLVECKFYADLQVFQGLVRQSGHLYNFWRELRKTARSYRKQPMLIARQNRMPVVCLLPTDAVPFLSLPESDALAHLPYWQCSVFSFNAFLGTARVPSTDDVLIQAPRQRVRL